MSYPGGAPVTIVGGTAGSTSSGASGAGTPTNPFVTSDPAATKTDRSVATSTASTQAAPANGNRKRLIIQNQDAAINVFLNLGAPATTGQGSIRLGPGGFLTLEGTSQALNIVAVSGTPIVTIWEFA